jgi:hypothetical protein
MKAALCRDFLNWTGNPTQERFSRRRAWCHPDARGASHFSEEGATLRIVCPEGVTGCIAAESNNAKGGTGVVDAPTRNSLGVVEAPARLSLQADT